MKEKSTKASQEAIKNTPMDQSAAPEAGMEGGRASQAASPEAGAEGGREAAAPEAPAPKRKRAKPKTLQEARADEGMKAEAAEEIAAIRKEEAEDRNRMRAHRSKKKFDPEKTSLEYLHDISRSLERIADGLETLERIERSQEKRVLYGLVDAGFF